MPLISAPPLVGVDKASDAIIAHVVPEKGTKFDWVASQLDRDVKKFGYHGRIVVKSDGENAVKDLMQKLARKRRDMPTVVETSKPYDSKSNGRAEGAVRKLESQVRTLNIATEKNIGILRGLWNTLRMFLRSAQSGVMAEHHMKG